MEDTRKLINTNKTIMADRVQTVINLRVQCSEIYKFNTHNGQKNYKSMNTGTKHM